MAAPRNDLDKAEDGPPDPSDEKAFEDLAEADRHPVAASPSLASLPGAHLGAVPLGIAPTTDVANGGRR